MAGRQARREPLNIGFVGVVAVAGLDDQADHILVIVRIEHPAYDNQHSAIPRLVTARTLQNAGVNIHIVDCGDLTGGGLGSELDLTIDDDPSGSRYRMRMLVTTHPPAASLSGGQGGRHRPPTISARQAAIGNSVIFI